MIKYCDHEKYVSRFWRVYTFHPPWLRKAFFGMPSCVCMYVCPLAPELLERLHSYSVLKSLSILRLCPMNLNFSLQNIGAFQMGTKTHNGNFLENGRNCFHWIEIIFRDPIPKQNCTGGIFRSITECALGSQNAKCQISRDWHFRWDGFRCCSVFSNQHRST
jgi:hypothetical protein